MIAIFKSTIHQCLTNDPKCLHNIKVYMVTMHTYIVHVENSDTIIEKASINNKYFNFILKSKSRNNHCTSSLTDNKGSNENSDLV